MQKPSNIILLTSLIGLVLIGFSGCDSKRVESDAAGQADRVEQWEPVSADELTAHQQAMADYAGNSRGLMGQRLMGTVMAAAEEGGFGSAVEVCQSEAEPIAEAIAERQGIAIGRTSRKLRNPDNLPPEWAREHVAADEDERFYAIGDEGSLATAIPIHIAAPCMNCHGATEHLADGVEEALAQFYPKDRAVGYEKGELRGWFWVEVPPDAVDLPPPPKEGHQEESSAQEMEPGEELYVQHCSACHGREGAGMESVFPPLVQTERVAGDPTGLIALSLDGVSGPLEVEGEQYDGFMPGQAQLSDAEMARLLTYIRSSWGNDAPEVTDEMVQTVRRRTADRTSAWNQADLDALQQEVAQQPWLEK